MYIDRFNSLIEYLTEYISVAKTSIRQKRNLTAPEKICYMHL